jgi:hypothetical protein
MKTEKKNAQGLYLQRSSNRWKWMAGATAATAAGVTASQAATITVNLLNNYISSSGGNHLNADLTGDGQPDITIVHPYFISKIEPYPYSYRFSAVAGVSLNDVHALAFWANTSVIGGLNLGSKHSVFSFATSRSLTGSIPIFFKDLSINGGARTRGSLEVTVLENVPGGRAFAEVQLDSLTYNTRNNIPDQGSSLALLAMGAGGVLALRRWRGAQARS